MQLALKGNLAGCHCYCGILCSAAISEKIVEVSIKKAECDKGEGNF